MIPKVNTFGPVVALVQIGLSLTGKALNASYPGLLVVPTTDIVLPGDYVAELQVDGDLTNELDCAMSLNSQVGLNTRLEEGLDVDLSGAADARLLLNAKYLLTPSGEEGAAFAMGVCNVGPGLKATPYWVGTRDLRWGRTHVDIALIETTGQWFVGLDSWRR